MKSILSVKISNELLEGLKKDTVVHVQGKGRHKEIYVVARKCGQRRWTGKYLGKGHRWPETKYILTGGLVISVTLQIPAGYSSWRKDTIRLKPGWTAEHVHRAVGRLLKGAQVELMRVKHVLQLEAFLKDIPDLVDLAEEEERRTGRTCIYSEMTVEQIDEWFAWGRSLTKV